MLGTDGPPAIGVGAHVRRGRERKFADAHFRPLWRAAPVRRRPFLLPRAAGRREGGDGWAPRLAASCPAALDPDRRRGPGAQALTVTGVGSRRAALP